MNWIVRDDQQEVAGVVSTSWSVRRGQCDQRGEVCVVSERWSAKHGP